MESKTFLCTRCKARYDCGLKIATAQCSQCLHVKCEHRIRYSTPVVICGGCVHYKPITKGA